MSSAEIRQTQLFLFGELFDTIHAAIFASVAYTSVLAKPKRQSSWNEAPKTLKEEDDWETGMNAILRSELNMLRFADFFDFLTTDTNGMLHV